METDKHFSKTRIAPTPSGFLHVGNLFSFFLTRSLANEFGSKLLLRIDDLDGERKEPAYVDDVFKTLAALAFKWDEGPKDAAAFDNGYSQSLRLALYNSTLDRLQKQGAVYACNCSRKDLLRNNADGIYPRCCREKNIPLDSPDVNWRLKCEPGKKIRLRSLYSGPLEKELPEHMNDFIVRKKNGLPAYQLASMVDDIHFGIDLVVRGNDLWPSTLAQLYLAQELDEKQFCKITFCHHTLLQNEKGEKLSKSAGHGSVAEIRKAFFAGDIFATIGKMLGVDSNLRTWQQIESAINKEPLRFMR